jgi:putative PIN family toxin of toxin-antitoxin system
VPPRKERVPVVLDTNVVLGFYLSRSQGSPNGQVFRLWRDQRKLQLILSRELSKEYLEVLGRLNVAPEKVARLAERLKLRKTITLVNLGARPNASRDPEDNFLLATALVGKASFLVTNDRDLLDIPATQRKRFKFEILTPRQLLARMEK